MKWWATRDDYWGRAIWRGENPPRYFPIYRQHEAPGGPWMSAIWGQAFALNVLWPVDQLLVETGQCVEIEPPEEIRRKPWKQ